MSRDCNTCEHGYSNICAVYCAEINKTVKIEVKSMNKSITFKKLNNLQPTVESCTLKMVEELGELCQLIGKGKGLSGEKVWNKSENDLAYDMMCEAFDVAQSAVTMAYTISDNYGMLNKVIAQHEQKLRERGYLK